ncbi:MAG: hypothetical protein ACUVQS_06510 [Candidatus Bipolaricaulaceae bacterium]
MLVVPAMSLGSWGQITLAFLLMVAAVVLAFLMVLRIIEPSLLLGLASFFLTLGGLIWGFLGLAVYVRERRSGP